MNDAGATPFPHAPRRALTFALSVLAVALGCGFSFPLVQEQGVEATFSSQAEHVDYAQPLIATLEVRTNAQTDVRIQDLRDRFKGFAVVEDFDAGQSEQAEGIRASWRLRLTPQGAGPWRLMPFVITLRDKRTGETREVATSAITLPAPPALPVATGEPECALSPEWVAPGWRTYGLWLLCACGGVLLVVAIFMLLKRLRRTLHERTLSPEERARIELERLLTQGLVAQGKFKRFYSELTGVVRRYFERGYALRATRQTTAEFLAVLTADPRFTDAERTALSDFLAAADRIKFANVSATAPEAEAAVTCARSVIATRPTPPPTEP